MHTVGVCAVVRRASGEVLLIRTAKAGWELPGGRVEQGEELHAALRREVLEETGYTVSQVGDLAGVYAHPATDTVLLVFRAEVLQETRANAEDEDALECAWLAPEQALQLVTHPSEHDRLADALANEASVVYRAY